MEVEAALFAADRAVVAITGKHLSDLETAVLRGAWHGQTYEAIADVLGYSPSYLTRGVGPQLWKLLSQALGEPVSKTNFRAALERRGKEESREDNGEIESQPTPAPLHPALRETATASTTHLRTHAPIQINWGEAPDVSLLYGREAELATLCQWVMDDQCRLVAILGMGGIGKTSLAAQLAHTLVNRLTPMLNLRHRFSMSSGDRSAMLPLWIRC